MLFPIGDIDKPTVRELAKKYDLSTAEKKDSTGICFIGERNFRKFLSEYIPMKPGKMMTVDGEIVGDHQGVFYYTIGQRRGLGIGGKQEGNGNRWFVLDKDVEKNILYVSQGEMDILFHNCLETDDFNFIPEKPLEQEFDCEVRIRHRQALQKAKCVVKPNGGVKLVFEQKQRAIAEGQYAVVYRGKYCLGGGVIERKYNV